MTTLLWSAAAIAFLSLAVLAFRTAVRHRDHWRTEQPSWWRRPIDSPGLRLSVRRADQPSPSEIVSLRDPRVVSARVTKRKAVGQ